MPLHRGPDGKTFRFPDDATPAEIQQAMQDFYDSEAAQQQQTLDVADTALSIAAGPLGLIGQAARGKLRERAQSGEAARDFAKDEGAIDRGGSLLERGYQSAAGGLSRVIGTVADNEALRRRAREGEQVAATDIAGTTSWDEAKQGGLGGYLKFGAETAIQSLPEMAITAIPYAGIPLEATIQAGRIGQERAQNDGRSDATVGDIAKAAPFGVASAALERVGIKGVGGKFGSSTVGKIVTGAATEAATEAAQSSIEYTGGVAGTQTPFDASQMFDEALAGAVGGGVGGGVITTTVEGGRVVHRVKSRKAGPGVVETAGQEASQVTPEDNASPLPNDAIATGRATVAAAEASPVANEVLAQAGLPQVKTPVRITDGETVTTGTIEDAFDGGVKVRMDNGSLFEAYFDDLNELGVRIEQQSPDAILATRAQAAKAESDAALADFAPEVVPVSETTEVIQTPETTTVGGDAIAGFKAKTRRVESGGNDTAKNPRSSAEGRYQFTDGTFVSVYRQEFGNTGESNAQILAKKFDTGIQERLMDRLTRDNAASLERAGLPVTEGNLYLAHFAGQYGAKNILQADPNAPIESVLGNAAVRANPFLRGKTAGDVARWANDKMGGGSTVQTETVTRREYADPYEQAFMDYQRVEYDQPEQTPLISAQEPDTAPEPVASPTEPVTQPEAPVAAPVEPIEPVSRETPETPVTPIIPLQANESPIVTPEAAPIDPPRLETADTGGAPRDAGGAPVEPLPDFVREPLVEAQTVTPVIETNRLNAIVRNADDATVQRINAALPDGVELKQRQDGGYSVPKRYEAQVRDAVAAPTEDFTQPRAVPELNDRSGSWVVVDRQTGKQVFETFERDTAERVNRDRYDVLTAAEYLGQFNQRVRDAGGVQPEGSTYTPLPREQRGGDLNPPAVRNEPRPPVRTAPPVEGTETRDTAVTTTGREIPVEYAVVDLNSLVTSHTTEGAVNPDFPAELQPRDRSRGTSQAQITEIASRLDPRLLGRTVKASDGAPIISPEGIVESGNGRTLAIAEAYRRGGERADAYRSFVEQQGFDTTGIEQPVLVRVRDTALSPQDVQAFTREANQRDTAGFSATEQAVTDAESLSADALSLYRGGDVDAAGNRDFVRRFMETIPTTERANMVAADGSISQDAIRRINAALVQKAYGNAQLVAKLNEASDNNIKAIGGALVDVAGQWSQMTEAARNGTIDPEMDVTEYLNEAVGLVDRARREGKSVADLVNQTDIFSGETVDPRTEAALRLMFHNTTKFIKPVSRSKLVEGLSFFADQAMLTSSGADLLGVETKATPEAVLARAREKFIEGQTAEQGGLFAGPGDAGVLGDVRQDGGNRDGTGESIPQESRVESRDGAAQAEKLRVTRAPQIDPAKLQARLAELQLDDKVNLAVTDLINGNPRIAGSYRNRLIKVAMQANQDAEATLNHEVVHAMKEMGLFRDAEWKALARNADIDSVRNRYQGLDEEALTEEAIADRYMKWVQGRKETGFVQKAFERIRDALRAIGQVFRGEGFTTAESVFRAMDSGKVGAREAGPLSINEQKDMVVYHGSPHDFDTFSLDAIGTGEGAQAYGWGLYFAGRKEIAEFYRDTLSGKSGVISFPNRESIPLDRDEMAQSAIMNYAGLEQSAYSQSVVRQVLHAFRVADQYDTLEDIAFQAGATPYNAADETVYIAAEDIVNQMADDGASIISGRLYTVDIPEDGEFLLWDKPLSEQPEKVREGIQSVVSQTTLPSAPESMRAGDVYEIIARKMVESGVQAGRGDMMTSLALKDAGIAGIKYLDGGSRSDGDGTYNYVLFDDTRAKVLEKYSIVDQTQSDAFKRWAGDDAEIVTRDNATSYPYQTGKPIVAEAFHGTARPDRVGSRFLPERATSGPNAFFTSSPELASRYAESKQDTSISDVERDYNNWYKVKIGDEAVPLADAWNRLPASKRVEIRKKAPQVGVDYDTGEEIVLDPTNTRGNGGYDMRGRRNPLDALVGAWLESGHLYDEETRFADVLELAGLDRKSIIYDDPYRADPSVYPVWIRMENPLFTQDIPAPLETRLKEIAANDTSVAEEYGIDSWDKTTITPREWVSELFSDNGTYAWTRIPDAITDVLRDAGYDGIVDYSGKGGATEIAPVFIPLNPSQVKSVFNSGAFDPTNHDIRYSLTDAPFERTADDGPGGVTPRETVSVLNAMRDPSNFDKITGAIDDLRVKLQDRMLPVRRLQEGIADSLEDTMNPYQGEEIMSGRAGARIEQLYEKSIEPLFEGMKRTGVSLDELETYLYARHAQERNAQIAKINPEFAPGEGSGMTDLQARAILSRVEKSGKKAEMDALASLVDTMNREALQTRVESGLLSQEEADAWQAQYENYVPLRGIKELSEVDQRRVDRIRSQSGISAKGKESKRAFGRRSEADNILAYSILQAEEAIVRAEKNRVAQQFLKLAQANPDPDLWTINKVETRRRINPTTGLVENYVVNQLTAEDADYTVTAKVDGKEVRVTMNRDNPSAKRIADAMRNLDGPEFGTALHYASRFNQYFSAINTRYNPAFVVTNALRDMQTLAVVSQQYESEMPGITAKVFADYPKAMFARKDGSGDWSKWRREWELAGGKVYYNQTQDLNQIRRDIERRSKQITSPNQAAKVWGKTFDALEAMNESVERAIRLSVYKNAREMGRTKDVAASMARNVTVNFTRKGKYGPFLNAFYAFFNASVQGNANLVRAAAKSSRVRKAMAGFVVAGFLSDMLNSMVAGDDDDGENFWEKVPAWEKERNLVLMLPGAENGEAIKIPLAYGLNALVAIGRNASAVMRGKKNAGEAAMDTALTFADAFNPVGGGGTWWNVLAPTALDPIADIAENKDFTGRPIQPEQNPFSPPVTPSSNYFPSVDPIAKKVAKGVNAATGGDDVEPGWGSFSPESLEYIAGYLTGGAGRFVSDVITIGNSAFDPTAELEIRDIPFAKSVVTQKSSSVDKTAYYERTRQVEQVLDRAKQYQERGDMEGLANYVERNRTIGAMEAVTKEAEKEMRKVRKARNETHFLHELGQIDDETYSERLDVVSELEEQIVQAYNKRWMETVEAE